MSHSARVTKPVVSVVMPLYNGSDFVRDTIQSVLDQTFTNFEFIIVNDGSTDDSVDIVQSFVDPRIHLINHPKNSNSISKVLNDGCDAAQGKYIATIDNDDIWNDIEKLQKQIIFLEAHTEYGLVGTCGIAIGKKGETLFNMNLFTTDEEIKKRILIQNPFLASSVLMRREAYMQHGPFDPSENYAQDYGLWCRIGRTWKLSNLSSYSLLYRISATSASVRNSMLQNKISLKIAHKHKGDYRNIILAYIKWFLKIVIVYFGFGDLIFRRKLAKSIQTKI